MYKIKLYFSQIALILFCIISASSCQNRFNVDANIAEKLSSIEIRYQEDTVEDYDFIRYLESLLNTDSKNKKYYLQLEMVKTISGLVIQKDAEPLRETIELNTVYKLFEIGSDKPILEGKVRLFNSYNTLFSPYSTDLEMHKSVSDVFKATASEIRRRLIIFLAKGSTT